MDIEEITQMLDSALLTSEEINQPEMWHTFHDPLPKWEILS